MLIANAELLVKSVSFTDVHSWTVLKLIAGYINYEAVSFQPSVRLSLGFSTGVIKITEPAFVQVCSKHIHLLPIAQDELINNCDKVVEIVASTIYQNGIMPRCNQFWYNYPHLLCSNKIYFYL